MDDINQKIEEVFKAYEKNEYDLEPLLEKRAELKDKIKVIMETFGKNELKYGNVKATRSEVTTTSYLKKEVEKWVTDPDLLKKISSTKTSKKLSIKVEDTI